MNNEFFIIIDGADRECNFYDKRFPNAFHNARLSAKEIEDSIILDRTITPQGEQFNKIIWRQKDD